VSYTVTLNTDGPCEPLYVLEVAEAVAEGVRVLNHLTRDHAALGGPSDADTLIRALASAVDRLPQLLDQVSGWLKREQEAGRIAVADPDSGGFVFPDVAVRAARLRLAAAKPVAEGLAGALDLVASVTTDLARREDGHR